MKIYSLQEENEKLNASRHEKQKNPYTSVTKQQTRQRGTSSAAPRPQKSQPQKRGRSILIGWFLFILFLFLIEILTDIL